MTARAATEDREQLYQYHISNVLCMIAENTARLVGDGGRYCTMTFYEIMQKPHEEKPKRTGREIVADIASRMGLEVIPDNGTA